ncbi:hypothetical protein KAX97_02765 [candidate division WOR-3 bacterium]|nr:hypothetical protein [candidate division WOR-3 bacterium]
MKCRRTKDGQRVNNTVNKILLKQYSKLEIDGEFGKKLIYEIHSTYDYTGNILEEIHYDSNGS